LSGYAEKSLNDESLRNTVGVIDDEAKPRFHSEELEGGAHRDNADGLKERATDRGTKLKTLLDRGRASEWSKDAARVSLEFSSAYARYRDYRNRYATPHWIRKRGWLSRKRGQFLRGVMFRYSGGGDSG
jgi:hypothetical protein